MTDIQHPTPADLRVGQSFASHVRAEIAADEFDGLRGSWRRFRRANPDVAAKYQSNEETAAWLLAVAAGDVAKERDELRAELRGLRDLEDARRIVGQVSRRIVSDEHRQELAVATATIQRESARANEMGGVIAHLVGVLTEVHRSTTVENARTFAEIALANIAAWHVDAWNPGPIDDAADWMPGHWRKEAGL